MIHDFPKFKIPKILQEDFLIPYLFTTIQLIDLILPHLLDAWPFVSRDDVDVNVIVVVVVLNSSEAHSNKVTFYIIVTFLWLWSEVIFNPDIS